MATGIKDKVVILGMGCSKFGERWNCGTEHLLSEAFQEALQDAGVERKQIEAAWFGSALDKANVGNSAIPLSTALRLEGIPVTRVENMCATGTEALRGAVYAVAAGAVDIALAIAGIWFIAAAMMGYSARPLGWTARVYHGVTGVGIFMPADAFGAGRWINAAGIGLAVALFCWEKITRRRAVAAGG